MYTYYSKQGCRETDVSRVRGMETSSDIKDSVPFSDSELAQFLILFWSDISTHPPFNRIWSAT